MARDIALQEELDSHRKQVDVENFDLTLRELVRMIEEREINLAPNYQRKFRWGPDDESYLIESLFLGLPVPNIFVAANADGSWEVVDGLQRLSTLVHFMADSEESLVLSNRQSMLKLEGLSKLTSFNGFTFGDLPRPLQLHFQKRSLRVTSISDKSDAEVRFEVFERLNKGGIVLSPQEVRSCINRGAFAELLRELSENGDFRSLLKLQKTKKEDGTSEELVLKFFAYLEWKDRYNGKIKWFLNHFMTEAANDSTFQRESLFIRVVETLVEIGPVPFLRPNYSLTPLNQLEAAMVAVGEIIQGGGEVVAPKSDWLLDEDFVKNSSRGTNSRTSFFSRIAIAKALLSGES